MDGNPDSGTRELFAFGIWIPLGCGILAFGIQNTVQGIWNPTSKFHRQRIPNPRLSCMLFLGEIRTSKETTVNQQDYIYCQCRQNVQ